MQAAEEAKAGDPELEEVESAEIDAPGGDEEKEEPFEKLAAAAKRLSGTGCGRSPRRCCSSRSGRSRSTSCARRRHRGRAAREGARQALRPLPRGGLRDRAARGRGRLAARTSPDNSAFARRCLKVKPQRLTRAALETLAIIAYRQPVTRPEIEEIRGVDCGAVVKALLERRLIKILGKKEEPGRPMLYGTTKEFLEFFALKDLASLPTLREFHELSEEHREIVEKQPEAQDGGISGSSRTSRTRSSAPISRRSAPRATPRSRSSSGRWRRPTRRLRPHRPRST